MKQIHKSKTALFGRIEKCTNPPNRSLTQLSPTQSHALPNFISPPTFSSTKHNKTKKTHLGSRRGEWNDMKCGISLELSPQKSSVESIRVFFFKQEKKPERDSLYVWLVSPPFDRFWTGAHCAYLLTFSENGKRYGQCNFCLKNNL